MKILYHLFYPWLEAFYRAAYWEYSLSELYDHQIKYGPGFAIEKFEKYNVNDYLTIAWKKHWFKIICMPWTFLIHPDYTTNDFLQR